MQPLRNGSNVFFNRQTMVFASQWNRFVNPATSAIWQSVSRLQIAVRVPSPKEIQSRLLASAKVATG